MKQYTEDEIAQMLLQMQAKMDKKLKEQKYALDKVILHWKTKYENEKNGKDKQKPTPEEFSETEIKKFEYEFIGKQPYYMLVIALPVSGPAIDARDYALANLPIYLEYIKQEGVKDVREAKILLHKVSKTKEGTWLATFKFYPNISNKQVDYSIYDIEEMKCPFEDEQNKVK
jgi:hypothetical protein